MSFFKPSKYLLNESSHLEKLSSETMAWYNVSLKSFRNDTKLNPFYILILKEREKDIEHEIKEEFKEITHIEQFCIRREQKYDSSSSREDDRINDENGETNNVGHCEGEN